MKKLLLYILLSLSLGAVAFGGAFFEFFNARSEGENVKLEWKTGNESNVQNFVIQRKTPQSSYSDITTIEPKGSNSYYSYIDYSAYKGTSLIFIYRVKIVDRNLDLSYSNEASVSPNVSGVKRTWGSIKAMFR